MSDTEDHGRQPPKIEKKRGWWANVPPRTQSTLGWLVLAVVVVVAVLWGNRDGSNSPPPMPGEGNLSMSSFGAGMAPQRPPTNQSQTSSQPVNPNPPQPPDRGGVTDGMAATTETKKRKKVVSFATTTRAAGDASTGSGVASPGAAPTQPQGTTMAWGDGTIPGSRAGPALDLTYVLRPGVYIFVLESAVNSEREGPFFAHAKDDIKSQAGVTLIDKGTQIVGTYSSGISDGQSRIVAVSTYGITPKGVPFRLGASVGDERGQNGMSAQIQRNHWPRIRNAAYLMLSQGAISSAQTALQSALQRGNSTNFNMNTSTMGTAITEALRGGNNIQDVGTKGVGEEVGILVTEPIIFDRSYGLEIRR